MIAVALLLTLAGQSAAPISAAAPLSVFAVYNGNWEVRSPRTMAGPGKPDHLKNHCNQTEAFYSCEQVVNGKPMALIIFIPASQSGHYYVQNVLPSGYSTGRGDLTIDGSHWTFSSKDVEGETTTFHKTENFIADNNHIRFEQYTSANGTEWTKTNEGAEVRLPG